jgi:hypothetical protein
MLLEENVLLNNPTLTIRVDILPVADPNIFSQTQRISPLAQTELQLAASNPQIHNQYEVYRNMYEALGVKDIDKILIRPQPPQPKDPALEHIDCSCWDTIPSIPWTRSQGTHDCAFKFYGDELG